jgi:16S rRNA C1402 (ribose-2'-O) methylase RsmI
MKLIVLKEALNKVQSLLKDIRGVCQCSPAALAVTLTSLCAQTCRDFNVIISDQTEDNHMKLMIKR